MLSLFRSLPGSGRPPPLSATERNMMNDLKGGLRKPEGGYSLISAGALLRCWRTYREGSIDYRAVRVWLAAHEVAARRCTLAKGRKPSYSLKELSGLVGVGEKPVRSS